MMNSSVKILWLYLSLCCWLFQAEKGWIKYVANVPTIVAVSAFTMPVTIQKCQQRHTTTEGSGHHGKQICNDVGLRISRPSASLLSLSVTASAECEDVSGNVNATAIADLKSSLLQAISKLRVLQQEYGDFSVDFGVKGGELNETSRAPRKVDFYSLGPQVGQAADSVLSLAQRLAGYNPTKVPTLYLGNSTFGSQAPLQGAWKLLFSTAADATFSQNSTRGDARAQNKVDAARGKITNTIEFIPKDTTAKAPLVKRLNVVLKATAASAQRVEIQFRYVQVMLSRFFFLPIAWSLYIPVPGPFLTRILVTFRKILSLLTFRRGKQTAAVTEVPKGYFDILYLDRDLRIHKTGEENIFIQAHETWKEAQPFLK